MLGTASEDVVLVVDVMAIGCLRHLGAAAAAFAGRLILTPHHGEMGVLIDRAEDEVGADVQRIACDAAGEHGGVVVLKGSHTVIAAPDGTAVHYGGGGTVLATGGSGHVLGRVISGLLSRGTRFSLQRAGERGFTAKGVGGWRR